MLPHRSLYLPSSTDLTVPQECAMHPTSVYRQKNCVTFSFSLTLLNINTTVFTVCPSDQNIFLIFIKSYQFIIILTTKLSIGPRHNAYSRLCSFSTFSPLRSSTSGLNRQRRGTNVAKRLSGDSILRRIWGTGSNIIERWAVRWRVPYGLQPTEQVHLDAFSCISH